MDKLCRLELVGITYNQIEKGVYAMVLQEVEEKHRRLVIIIGTSEAQSIECKLQNIIPPRPLAHDFIDMLLYMYEIKLKKVEIYRLENGVFAAYATFSQKVGQDESSIKTIDVRSSDAIALAIRTNSPIYCSDALLEEVGYYDESALQKKLQTSKTSENDLLTSASTVELASLLKKAVDEEQYELASKIKAELDRRNTIK